MSKRIISIIAVIMVVAMLSALLIACSPSSVADAKAKLEKKGYKVDTIDKNAIYYEKKGDKTMVATAMFFTDKKKQEEAFDQAKASYDMDKAENQKKGWIVKKTGKWVIMGKKEAVNALL